MYRGKIKACRQIPFLLLQFMEALTFPSNASTAAIDFAENEPGKLFACEKTDKLLKRIISQVGIDF